MDYTDYKKIQIIKKSDKAEIIFASVEGLDKPVVVKRLVDGDIDIYRLIAQLDNVHIPTIYSVTEQEDALVIVEEYIPGVTLEEYLAENAASDKDKFLLMEQICDALEVLHNCNPPMIHRDIKPSNILVSDSGIIKIIDFDASRRYKAGKNTSDTRLLGTIEYAAPEQFGYAQTDYRSDIYSLGVVFSELVLDESASYKKDWKKIVDKCTNFDPQNRYSSVSELKKDLLYCIKKAAKPDKQSRIPLYAVITGLVLIIICSILCLQRTEPSSNELPTETPTSALSPTGNMLVADLSENSLTLTPTPIPSPTGLPSPTPTVIPSPTGLPSPTPTVTPSPTPTVTPSPTPTPTPTLTPTPAPGAVMRYVYIDDKFSERLSFEEFSTIPVWLHVKEEFDESIERIYLGLSENGSNYPDEIQLLSKSLYELSDDNRSLYLPEAFFDYYKANDGVRIYLEFSNGEGENVSFGFYE